MSSYLYIDPGKIADFWTLKPCIYWCRFHIKPNTVEHALTATLYNGHLSIAVTIEQFRLKFHNIDPVYSGHLLNAASGTLFAVPY